jgi:PPOX class probable F420-dependent enzyme
MAPRAERPNMRDYGLAAADAGEGLFPWSWAEERLTAARTYWVSTVRGDGAPHCAPVWALWFDDAIVFSTAPSSRKAVNLTRDPRCVISVEVADDAVIVEGVVETTSYDAAQIRDYCSTYSEKYAFAMDDLPDPLLALRPRVVFGFVGSGEDGRFANTATRWTF